VHRRQLRGKDASTARSQIIWFSATVFVLNQLTKGWIGFSAPNYVSSTSKEIIKLRHGQVSSATRSTTHCYIWRTWQHPTKNVHKKILYWKPTNSSWWTLHCKTFSTPFSPGSNSGNCSNKNFGPSAMDNTGHLEQLRGFHEGIWKFGHMKHRLKIIISFLFAVYSNLIAAQQSFGLVFDASCKAQTGKSFNCDEF